jgi:hypothetical protein
MLIKFKCSRRRRPKFLIKKYDGRPTTLATSAIKNGRLYLAIKGLFTRTTESCVAAYCAMSRNTQIGYILTWTLGIARHGDDKITVQVSSA